MEQDISTAHGSQQNPFANLRIRTLVLFLLITFPFLVLLYVVSNDALGTDDALIESLGASVWFYGVTVLWMRYQFKRKGISWKRLFGSFPEKFNWFANLSLLLCLVLFNFGSLFASFGLLSFLMPDFVVSFMNDQPNTQSFNPGLFLIVDTIAAIIIAPIVEELLMRGVFLHRFQLKWGLSKAIIIAAIIFAVGHANLVGMFMVALVLSLLYLKYKTLWVPIFFHAMNNTMVSLLQFLSGGNASAQPVSLSEIQDSVWVGIVLVILSLPILLQFLIKNWPHGEDRKKDLVMPYFANEHSVLENLS